MKLLLNTNSDLIDISGQSVSEERTDARRR